mmetsp:Transcript_11949/g.24671  ORF Transcript_11949/g.24671 Transcript_11949/m.24671 type:complete len:132 (-) Transcript_11949:162-557(-)
MKDRGTSIVSCSEDDTQIPPLKDPKILSMPPNEMQRGKKETESLDPSSGRVHASFDSFGCAADGSFWGCLLLRESKSEATRTERRTNKLSHSSSSRTSSRKLLEKDAVTGSCERLSSSPWVDMIAKTRFGG